MYTCRIRLLLSILEGKVTENPPGCGLDLQNFVRKDNLE